MNVLNANEVYTLKLLNDELHAMWILPQYKQKKGGWKKSRKEDKSAIQGSLEWSPLPLTLLTKTLSPVHWCTRPDAPLQHNNLLGLGKGLCTWWQCPGLGAGGLATGPSLDSASLGS